MGVVYIFVDMFLNKRTSKVLLLTIVLLVIIILAYFICSSNNTYDKLYEIENNNYLYYDNDNDLFLEYNRDDFYFDIYNNKGVKYEMLVRRGFGRHLFVSFYEDDNVIFVGSMRITKDEQIIIETENELYNTMKFSKQ